MTEVSQQVQNCFKYNSFYSTTLTMLLAFFLHYYGLPSPSHEIKDLIWLFKSFQAFIDELITF